MSRLEAAPLLGTSTPTLYKTIGTASADSLGPADLSASAILATYNKRFEPSIKMEKKKQNSLITM
ncbi:hypothetical protein O3G_MSEX014170 [Manduca sexta]|uniref:Uncharacterized protein n=1 Tax=Manduca sexta TaxID=7130 RepID=A0A922CZ97_MANSE|nr:hypothetical protein O3G_MSEX014170 [Manduca sexta]